MNSIIPQKLNLEGIMMQNNVLIDTTSKPYSSCIILLPNFIYGHIQLTTSNKYGIGDVSISLFANVIFPFRKDDVAVLSSFLVNCHACDARFQKSDGERELNLFHSLLNGFQDCPC